MMGQRRAFEFLVMGHPLNATRAKDFGIANLVVDPQDVDAAGAQGRARDRGAAARRGRGRARIDARRRPRSCMTAIDQEGKIFSERLRSPEAKAAFEAFFARKR